LKVNFAGWPSTRHILAAAHFWQKNVTLKWLSAPNTTAPAACVYHGHLFTDGPQPVSVGAMEPRGSIQARCGFECGSAAIYLDAHRLPQHSLPILRKPVTIQLMNDSAHFIFWYTRSFQTMWRLEG
jgi:hypothetical protein